MSDRGMAFLVLAAVVFLLCLVGAEVGLRLNDSAPADAVSNAGWLRRLRAVEAAPGKSTVVFYGSSRPHIGFVPSAFDAQMAELGRPTRTHNLAQSATMDLGLLAHVDNAVSADIVIVEQLGFQFSFPVWERDLEAYAKLSRLSWMEHVEDEIQQRLARLFYICRSDYLFALRARRFHESSARPDGWLKTVFNRDPGVLQGQRDHWAAIWGVADLPAEVARPAQETYRELFERVRARGAKLVVVRMPVIGKVGEKDDAQLAEPHHRDWLHADERIIYVDANEHRWLKHFKPIDDSHLDAEDAVRFSRDLAVVIDDELAKVAKVAADEKTVPEESSEETNTAEAP